MSVTMDGLIEFAQQIDALAVRRDALQGAARESADQVAGDIRGTASARGWELANEVQVTHDEARQFYRVVVKPKPPRPANLPIWLEYGTVHMHARPFVRPAVKRADGQ